MTRTFLVACDIEPTTDVDDLAAEIFDSLTLDGIPATSVKPWASAMTDQSQEDLFSLGLPGNASVALP